MSYCDSTAFLGMFLMIAAFVSGYIIARHYVWSNKTNQLISIVDINTTEGKRKP